MIPGRASYSSSSSPAGAAPISPAARHEALLHAGAVDHLDLAPRVGPEVVILIADDEGNSCFVQTPHVSQISPKSVKAFRKEGLEGFINGEKKKGCGKSRIFANSRGKCLSSNETDLSGGSHVTVLNEGSAAVIEERV